MSYPTFPNTVLASSKPHAELSSPSVPAFARQDAQVSLLTAPLVRQGAQVDLFERKETARKRSQDGETVDPSPTRKSSNSKSSASTPHRKISSPRSSKRPRQSSDPLMIWDEDKHHAKMLACHTIPELQRYYDLLLEKRQMQLKFGYEVQMKMAAKGRETHVDSPTRVKTFRFSVADAFVQQRRQATADILAMRQSNTTTTTSNTAQVTIGSLKCTASSSTNIPAISYGLFFLVPLSFEDLFLPFLCCRTLCRAWLRAIRSPCAIHLTCWGFSLFPLLLEQK